MPGIDDVRDHRDDASLGDLFLDTLRFYRQFGRLLVPLALVLAVAAGVAVALRPAYGVTALLKTPEMTLEQWRKLQPMLSDQQLVAASLAATKLPDGLRERLQRQFTQPRYWETRVNYRSAVERNDIRQQVNIDPKTVGALGLEVSLIVPSEAAASQQLQAIAEHVRQVMLWSGLRNYLDDLREQTLERRLTLQIAQIDQRFAIEQSTQRTADMQKLLEQYPKLGRDEVNTVVSVSNGGGKYLSPLAQIVALQATIADTRADLRQGQRELEQLDWKQRFLDRVGSGTRTLYLGTALDALLQASQHALFDTDANDSPARRGVAHEIQLNLSQQRWHARQVRYEAMPALSVAPIPTRRPLLVATAVFAGTLLAMSLMLALYVTTRRLGKPDIPWSVHRDPLFAWWPAKLRQALLGPPDAFPPERK